MSTKKKRIVAIWTDGSCIHSNSGQGPGGWAYLIQIRKAKANNQLGKMTHEFECSGGYNMTTANEMEMSAAIEALRYVHKLFTNHHIIIYSDSMYLVDGMNGVSELDKQNKHCLVNNQELWNQLQELSDGLKIHWTWIKGHDDCQQNIYVDEVSRWEATKRCA